MSPSDTGTVPAPPGDFSCDIDVAARGWDHDAWCGEFFPADLPREWRLAFYANHFRSVLVPGSMLLGAEIADLAVWRADTHEAFRFFLEISARLVERFRSGGAAALVGWLEPLEGHIAGLVLRGFLGPRDTTFLHWLEALGDHFAMHELGGLERVAAASASPVLAKRLPCWRPGLEGHRHGGCLGLLERPATDLPGLRRQIEAFMAHARQAERATLCVTGSPPPLPALQQAQILVELLGG